MKLFDRLWKSAATCTYDNSAAVRSEIGHDAVRRYYWVRSKCGEKVYIRDWTEMSTVLLEHPGTGLSLIREDTDGVIAAPHQGRQSHIRRLPAGMRNV